MLGVPTRLQAFARHTGRPMAKPVPRLSPADIAQVLDTAWHAPDPLTAVLYSHGLSEGQLVALLRRELTPAAFKLWSQRLRLQGSKAPSRDGFRGAAPKAAGRAPARAATPAGAKKPRR